MEKIRSTVYVRRDLWKKFREICIREGETISMKVEAWIQDYVNKHDRGNPQMRLDVKPEGSLRLHRPKIEECAYYGGQHRDQVLCKRMGTWFYVSRCHRCKELS